LDTARLSPISSGSAAPKTGSIAVHEALVQHPQLFLSPPKEPKFFLTGGARPRRDQHRGPGDAHSAREWIWSRERYERLFDAKLIAVIRDPVDRACHWTHLWCDGLETQPAFVAACRKERERRRRVTPPSTAGSRPRGRHRSDTARSGSPASAVRRP
jgi:hypothetical protein